MAHVDAVNGTFSVRAYAGDFKTLLAFNLAAAQSVQLAGFTIAVKPQAGDAYYLLNELQFETPGDHAMDAQEPATSSINAPFHKFRWVHVPGSFHQGLEPYVGLYMYTVTPRYFNADQSLQPLDPARSASVTINVAPFVKGTVELGFTRGFTQSQAFVHHFGIDALIQPKTHALVFPTNVNAGTNAAGETFTYDQEWAWLGSTARTKIFGFLDAVIADPAAHVDVFAYDLSEPNIIAAFLILATQRRIRVLLDDSKDHHSSTRSLPEDAFETQFRAAGGSIVRGHFARYAHDKVLVVYGGDPASGAPAVRVLTGSTNFSVTGLYVNANHVVVFNDPKIAQQYADVFAEAWADGASATAFMATALSNNRFRNDGPTSATTYITFAPHTVPVAASALKYVSDRIDAESRAGANGSVLFAVMSIDQGTSSVYTDLLAIHDDQDVFSYGISDDPGGITLYKPGSATGVLVTGKPRKSILPPPFDEVRVIGGLGHQVHHKFIVCGFTGPDPTVFCGSSNLAAGGEHANGDNLIEIHDGDIATAFALEAVALVDHFAFLDKYQTGKSGAPTMPVANEVQGAVDAGWFLDTTNAWTKPYFDAADLHYRDRLLFAGA